jgi:hypothetical protein
MKYRSITRRAFGLGVLIAAAAGGSAHAATPSDTSACNPTSYALSQPYLSMNDSNLYTLAPGQEADSFDGAGWALTGGARIVSTTMADGSIGTVLYLPPGSRAVSAPMCVDSEFPTARVNVRQGGSGSGLKVSVAYTGSQNGGQSGVINSGAAWSVSRSIQLHVGNLSGWQEARYTFAGPSKGGAVELYDFYVDPRCRV